MSPRPPGLAVRLYRVALRLYDPAFRRRHGREMARVFAERLRDAPGVRERWTFVLGAFQDVLVNGIGSRLEAGRGEGPGVSGGGTSTRGGGMDGLWRDGRYALRSLRKSPGFTLVAVATIGLGIGANTAIFSVVHTVLMRPLPYPDADELVMVWGEMRARDILHFPLSPPDFDDVREGVERFADIGAVFSFQQPLAGDGDPVQVEAGFVTPGFLGMLGIEPMLGRGFVPGDGIPDEPGVQPGSLPSRVILGHGLWRQRFGGDPDAIGTTVELGGASAEIVGVLPPGVELLLPPEASLPDRVDLWVAARLDFANAPRNNVFLLPVARLRSGATIEQADVQLQRVAEAISSSSEATALAGFGLRLEPLHEGVTADVRPFLGALLGAVTFVLLIACANVANLVLVRAAGRERELAVRAAMGGSRTRLVRQLLLESGALAAGGALVGLALAAVGIRVLVALQPEGLPRVDAVSIDGTVLAFTAAAALAAATIFGVLPALQASRVDLAGALRERTGGTGGRRGARSVRNGVVVAEVALSVVLLVGAGLMVRSFVELARVEPGYEPEGLVAVDVPIPFGRYSRAVDRWEFQQRVKAAFEAVPGVEGAVAAFPLPLSGTRFNGRYGDERAEADFDAFRQADYRTVLPGYFEAMGTRLIAGRTFTEADQADSLAVVVVDDVLAETLWPGRDPVGQRMLVRVITPEAEWVEVIGVVEHQRATTLAAEGAETVYFPDRYVGGFAASWILDATLPPSALAAELRAALDAVDPQVPLDRLRPFEDDVAAAMASTRFALTLIGIFGILALTLACVGLYGVLSYLVRQRTSEIGLRLAFGADRGRILRMVVGQGARLALVGVGIGLLAALPLSRVMESLVVGIRPTDPLTYGTIALVFLAVATLACLMPARRATRVDPGIALREG